MEIPMTPKNYTPEHMRSMFDYAKNHDVDDGGVYDCRMAAINVWSHPHNTWDDVKKSQIVASFYFDWDKNQLWKIETEDEDLALIALEELEKRSF